MRALCRAHGSASRGRGTAVSAEAPPGLGFRSVPEAAGLLDRLQRVAGGSKRRRQRERSEGGRWHFPLAALPPALRRKAGNAVLEAWEGGRCSHLIPDLMRRVFAGRTWRP